MEFVRMKFTVFYTLTIFNIFKKQNLYPLLLNWKIEDSSLFLVKYKKKTVLLSIKNLKMIIINLDIIMDLFVLAIFF